AVTFNVGGPGNFTWDYGDGSTGSGTSSSHQYAIPGVYTVTVTETDPNTGLTTSATLTITVHGAPFRISRATIKLSSGHDKATLWGVLHIPAGTSLAGQKLVLSVGTNSITFTLDSHGKGKSGGSSVKVRQKGKSSQEGTFTAVITGDLLAGLKANMPLDS